MCHYIAKDVKNNYAEGKEITTRVTYQVTPVYRVVRCRTLPATDYWPRDNFWTIFRISSILGTIAGPDLYITWLDFRRFWSWPWSWIVKVKYGICYISATNGPIATER